MIEAIIHGLVSGLIWSAILGSCLIAIAAVITVTVPARPRARSETAGTTHALGESRIPETVPPGPGPGSRERRGSFPRSRGAGVCAARAGRREPGPRCPAGFFSWLILSLMSRRRGL